MSSLYRIVVSFSWLDIEMGFTSSRFFLLSLPDAIETGTHDGYA